MSRTQVAQSTQAFRLDGRHALVTGGASGIGEATAKELVHAGAFVWIADINLYSAQELAKSIGSSQALHLDVTSPESIHSALSHIGHLDILVNNAGIGHVGSIQQTEPEDFDRLLNVNVRAVYLVTRAFLPLLLATSAAGGLAGTVVNIASVAGLVGIKQRFAYCTTKGAVVAMTRQIAVEYPKTLRVNAICPGTVETPSSRAISKNSTTTTRKKFAPNSAPANRSAASAGPKKSHQWFAISPQTKPLSSPVPSSTSTAAGPLREVSSLTC